MTSSSDAERLIYLSGYHLSYTSADKIIETYETPEGRANALYTLDELLMSSLERGGCPYGVCQAVAGVRGS